MTSGIFRPDSDGPSFERHLEKQMGCMAGFFEIFNLNQRTYGPKRISSLTTGSTSPSQRSDFSAREPSDMLPSSPENMLKCSPAPKTPVSAFDFKEGIKNSWKLREAPRLSLDSRLKPSQIRAPPANYSPASYAEQCPNKNRPSPSVVAKLMGLDNLPGNNGVTGTAAELRRSASESRVCRDLNPFFLSEPDFKLESCKHTQTTVKRASPQQGTPVVQRRSNFSALEFYPEPNNRSQMLKIGGTEEPSRDLEALKQVLEALQLKGLLHSRAGGNVISDKPIVVMKPGPKPGKRWNTVVQEKQVRSLRKNVPVLGAHCSSSKLSPRRIEAEMVTNRSPRNRRLVKGSIILPIEDDSTGSIFDLERLKLENKTGENLLERCNKLVKSISAFTSTDQLNTSEQQPSPVSVLDSAFLNEESSPSPVKKCSINFKDPFEEWEFRSTIGPKPANMKESEYTDYAYVSDVVSAFDHYPNMRASDVYLFLEQHHNKKDASKESILNRSLLFNAIDEILERKHHHSPWNSFSRREDVIKKVWAEVSSLKDVKEMEDLNEFTCEIIRKDLTRGGHEWGDLSVEISDAVLYVERLMFRDLVGEMVRDFADAVVSEKTRNMISRRKLLF